MRWGILVVLLIIESVLFGYWFVTGTNGVRAIVALKQQQKELAVLVEQEIRDLTTLELANTDFVRYPYYKEKIARERLLLARPQEDIYFFGA